MDSQAAHIPLSQESLVPSTEISASVSPPTMSPEPVKSAAPAKFPSPVPPQSSMSPPPSSQVQADTRSSARTPTPPTPLLTSPPSTTKIFSQSSMPDAGSVVYAPDEINDAPADQRRTMVADLCKAYRDMRLSAAHYKLQYNMVSMQLQELENRMAVELEMTHREIDVLKQADEKRRSAQSANAQESPLQASQAVLISDLNRTCQMQQHHIHELQEQLREQKCLTELRAGELASALEENDRLKSRIRRNRDHISQFLPYDQNGNEHGSPRSIYGTPHQPTPRQRHRAATQAAPHGHTSHFDALLLADQMLSRETETATAPVTPNRAQHPRSRYGHVRSAQSMSSLPHTPNRGRPSAQTTLHTPSAFNAVNVPQSAPPAHYQQPHKLAPPHHLRRESSNSTITASSVDDDEEANTEREDNGAEHEVPESPASQMATSMLRRSTVSLPQESPRASQKGGQMQMQPPSHYASQSQSQHQSHSQSERQSQLVQSKIFGRVKKSVTNTTDSRDRSFEKRRLPSDLEREGGDVRGSPQKKRQVESGVGLGIGGFVRE